MFTGQITDQELNFKSRLLWVKYVNKAALSPDVLLFNNGFRVFGSAATHILDLDQFEVHVHGLSTELARLQKGSVTRELNFVVGRNGSGKTLFLRFLAGHFPINPFWPNIHKLFVSTNLSK